MEKSLAAWEFLRGLEPLSLCDWPGRATAVLFFGGCNLRCPTCHNHDIAWRMHELPKYPRWRAMVHLTERKLWLDGVTITGGEPTVVPKLPEFLTEIRQLGLPVKLDTNGMRPQVVAELLDRDLVDVFAVDVKGPFAKYPALTGRDMPASEYAERVNAIFALAAEHPGRFYFRTTKVPELTGRDVETVRAMLPDSFNLVVQEYQPPRRKYAFADQETGRQAGNMVHGPNRSGHPQGPERQRHQGPAPR